MSRGSFPYEDLDAFKVAVEAARLVRSTPFGRGMSALRDQAVRASQSVVLNIAEGSLRTGQARRNHYEIARASAGEAASAFFMVEHANSEPIKELYRRVSMMLLRMGV